MGFSRLNFTEIDPDDPSRIFSFVLLVNDDEKYDIANCNPKIDDDELIEILDELNGSGGEDISILARRMRKFDWRERISIMTSVITIQLYFFLIVFYAALKSFIRSGRAFKEVYEQR